MDNKYNEAEPCNHEARLSIRSLIKNFKKAGPVYFCRKCGKPIKPANNLGFWIGISLLTGAISTIIDFNIFFIFSKASSTLIRAMMIIGGVISYYLAFNLVLAFAEWDEYHDND